MNELLEFAEKLKELEQQKKDKINFCKQHNFTHEVEWLRNEYTIIQEIRMEMQNCANGIRKPSDAKFVF